MNLFEHQGRELYEVTKSILGLNIKGHVTKKVMVAQKLDFAKEHYASFLVDRASRRHLLIFSPDGGVEIESVPEERLFKATIDPMTGFQPFHARAVLGQPAGLAPRRQGRRRRRQGRPQRLRPLPPPGVPAARRDDDGARAGG